MSLYRRKGGRAPERPQKQELDEHSYLDAYANFTDTQVDIDPHKAVGGAWEEIGRLQFDFLLQNGLLPMHRLLDIGCGTLRAGRHFIRYLEPANYCGIDISPKAIEYANELVREEGLSDKRPTLLTSTNKDLRFAEFAGDKFSFLLAQSVFTHLPPASILECLQHLDAVMADGGVFYFTYNESAEPVAVPIGMDFRYPVSFFQSAADDLAYVLRDCSVDYPHPRGQRMLELSRSSEHNAERG